MLDIIKSGVTQYGVWVYGTLHLKGLEITDIFQISNSKEEITDKSITIKKLSIKRNRNNNIRFIIEL